MNPESLAWQSKLVLLLVVPAAATDVALRTGWWAAQQPTVAVWTLGLSLLLGLVTWQLRAATPAAAVTGATITASLMYSTAVFPYAPLHTALVPVLAVSLLAFAATRMGREKKSAWAGPNSATDAQRHRLPRILDWLRWCRASLRNRGSLRRGGSRTPRQPRHRCWLQGSPPWRKPRPTPSHRRLGRCLADARECSPPCAQSTREQMAQ